MLGPLVGFKNAVGYLTSGGTEGNLAGMWWNNLYLSRHKQKFFESYYSIKTRI